MESNVIIEPYGFVYITTCLANGKRYLGQRKFNKGWQNYIGSGNAFTKAVSRYGRENFTRSIIDICYSAEELNEAERAYSLALDVVEDENYYNLVQGGGTSAGWKPSEETRKKISEAHKGEKNVWYGRKHTQEEKRKIGAARKGMKLPKEWRENISAARTGQKISEEAREKLKSRNAGENNPMFGKTQTLKAKTAQSKAVLCEETGLEYYSIREAARETGVTRANIWRALNGEQQTAGGYTWRYVEREE